MAHKRTIWKLFTFLFNFGVFIIRSVIEQTEWWQQLLACLPRPLYDNPTSSLQRLRRRLVCVLIKPHVDILMISCKCCSVRGENRSKWKWEVCVWLEWPKWLTSFQSMQSFVERYCSFYVASCESLLYMFRNKWSEKCAMCKVSRDILNQCFFKYQSS